MLFFFFTNDFKFCAVKKDYKDIQWYSTKTWKCYSYRFSKIWKSKVQAEQTQTRHRFSQQLQTTWYVSEILYL